MEAVLNKILEELQGLKEGQTRLECNLSRVENRLSTVEGNLSRVEDRLSNVEVSQTKVEQKLEAIYNQTGELSEFRTKVKNDFEYLLLENAMIKKDIYQLKQAK